MKLSLLGMAVFALATVNWSNAHAAESAQPTNVSPAVARDVALAPGGLLRGHVVDAKGVAMKGAPVSVWHENYQVAQTVTDENGQFSVTGLRAGVHRLQAGQGGDVYRFWTAEAAPPGAQPGSVVVPGEAVVRGQNGTPVGSILQSPILWGGVMYTAGHIIGFNAGIDRTPSSP